MTTSPTTTPLHGQRVLVVEDQYYVAVEMGRLVRSLGGEVIGPARNVDAAMGLMDERAPDLSILDVNLDGGRVYPLADALRARGAPFLFATGYEPWAIEQRFADTPTVSKPVTAPALTAALAKLAKAVASRGEA